MPTERHVEEVLATAPPSHEVSTLRRFLERTFRDERPGWAVATREESLLAAREALDTLAGAAGFRYPDDPVDRVRFVEAVDRAAGTLRAAGIRPEHLAELGAPRTELTAALLGRVDALLADAHLVDRRSLGHAAAGAIRSGSVGAGFAGIDVVAFARFEEDDLAAIEALHDASRGGGGAGVTVHLPRLPHRSEALDAVADALEARWAAHDDAPDIAWTPTCDDRKESVIDALSPAAEARAVARTILDAIADDTGAPIPLERIAIVVPDLGDDALGPLRASLDEAGIPFSEMRGPRPLSSPEATAALGILEMAAGTVTRDHVIELLLAPGLHAGSWTRVRDEMEASRRATRLAHRLREVPVVADRTGTLLVESLRDRVDGRRPDDAWMPGAVEQILSSVEGLRASTTRVALAQRLLGLFDLLKLGRPSAGELGRTLAAGGRALRAIAEGSSALRALRDALDRLRTGALRLGLAERPQSPAELLAELMSAVQSAPGAGAGAAGRAAAVRIALPAAVCGLDLGLAVITRVSPRTYGRLPDDDPWLDDAAPPPSPAPRAELAWAAGSARRVVWTTAREDPEEEAEEPHPFVAQALAAGASRRIEPVSRLAEGASLLDGRGRELTALARGATPASDLLRRVDAERDRIAFFLDPRLRAGRFTGHVPLDDPEHLVRCVGGDSPAHTVPVTSIERAAVCPFAGFARRVLGISVTADAEEADNPRDRGTLVHRALHAAFVTLGAHPTIRDDEAIERAREAASIAVGITRAASPLRREAMRQAIEDAMSVVAFTLAEPGWRVAFSEQRFGAARARDGGGEAWSSLAIEADGEDAIVYVDGQIDRVDRGDGGAVRVFDVKTGRPPSPGELGRTAFQLPLYAEAAADALGASDVAIGYLRVRPGGRIEITPRPDTDDAVSTPDRRRVAALAGRDAILRLWRGDAPPRPVTATACAYCDARDVCRRPAVMPIEDELEDRP